MDIIGEWTLYYDWGCIGKYGNAGIVFTSDGHFETSEKDKCKGNWYQVDDMILWQYDGQPVVAYAGNIGTNMMSGLMGMYDSKASGRWHAIKSASEISAKEGKLKFRSNGEMANL